MATATVQPVVYPQKVELTLRVGFECQNKEDQDYLQTVPGITDSELVQLGFLADLFDVWNNNALPRIIEINGFSIEQIKQQMLGTIL